MDLICTVACSLKERWNINRRAFFKGPWSSHSSFKSPVAKFLQYFAPVCELCIQLQLPAYMLRVKQFRQGTHNSAQCVVLTFSIKGTNGISTWCLQLTLKEISSHQDGSFPVLPPMTRGPLLSGEDFGAPLKTRPSTICQFWKAEVTM